MSSRVLLVEDDAQMREIVEEVLADAGIDVISVATGRDALRAVSRTDHPMACVLLDLTLPDMAGEDVLEELRRWDPNMPVILTSGVPEAEATSRLAGRDPAGFLQKPFRSSSLLAAIRPWLR